MKYLEHCLPCNKHYTSVAIILIAKERTQVNMSPLEKISTALLKTIFLETQTKKHITGNYFTE